MHGTHVFVFHNYSHEYTALYTYSNPKKQLPCLFMGIGCSTSSSPRSNHNNNQAHSMGNSSSKRRSSANKSAVKKTAKSVQATPSGGATGTSVPGPARKQYLHLYDVYIIFKEYCTIIHTLN